MIEIMITAALLRCKQLFSFLYQLYYINLYIQVPKSLLLLEPVVFLFILSGEPSIIPSSVVVNVVFVDKFVYIGYLRSNGKTLPAVEQMMTKLCT